jgi:hypothetical protein
MRALFLARDDQSEQINLLSCGPIMLTKSGWKPTGAWHDKGPKQETFGLMMQTATPEEIVALTNSIEKALREQYVWHTRPTEAIGWWLYWQAEGEAGLKRAVIVNRPTYASADGKAYESTLEPAGGHSPFIVQPAMKFVLKLWLLDWEDAEYQLFANASLTVGTITSSYVVDVLPSVVGGTLDGRIELLTIERLTGGAFSQLWPMYTMWAGIYYNRNVLATDFDPLFNNNAPYVVGADTNKPTVNSCAVSFATTPQMAKRVQICFGDVRGLITESVYRGRFVVLVQLDNAQPGWVVSVQGRWGGKGSPQQVYGPVREVFHNGSFGHWVELGEMQMPLGPARSHPIVGNNGLLDDTAARTHVLEIWAGLQTGSYTGLGTNYLKISDVLLIPAEKFVKLDGVIDATTSGQEFIYIRTNADHAISSQVTITAPYQNNPHGQVSARDWWMPTEGGRMVIAANVSNGTNIAVNERSMLVAINGYNRWSTYRGVI